MGNLWNQQRTLANNRPGAIPPDRAAKPGENQRANHATGQPLGYWTADQAVCVPGLRRARLFFFAGAPASTPHSGIATLTTLLQGSLHLQDSKGLPESLDAGGIEWMQAGRGVWHGGPIDCTGSIKLFQLWVALPSDLELTDSSEIFLRPEEIPTDGPARILLGGPERTGKPDWQVAAHDLSARSSKRRRTLALHPTSRSRRAMDLRLFRISRCG